MTETLGELIKRVSGIEPSNELLDALTERHNTIVAKLEAKVEAANKKLEKEIKAYSNNTMRPAIHDEFIMVLKNIKASIEIPRKEKCQVGGVPQNVATCKELKENTTP